MVKDGYKFAAAPLLLGIVALGLHWNWLGGVLIFLGFLYCSSFAIPKERRRRTRIRLFLRPTGASWKSWKNRLSGKPAAGSASFSRFSTCT